MSTSGLAQTLTMSEAAQGAAVVVESPVEGSSRSGTPQVEHERRPSNVTPTDLEGSGLDLTIRRSSVRRGRARPPRAGSVHDQYERDVVHNFLIESHFYRGFYYMMKHGDSDLSRYLRTNLMPHLALSLEAMLHDLIQAQLQEEEAAAMSLQHRHDGHADCSSDTLSNSGSGSRMGMRQHPTFPTGNIHCAMNPIRMLATELRKRAGVLKRTEPPTTVIADNV